MHVAICTPARSLIDPDHSQAVILTIARLREQGATATIYRTRGHSLLEQARSAIATGAYEWGADVMLWVDDDIIFDPEDGLSLIHTVGKGVDGVGAVCSTKRPGAPINAGLAAHKVRFYEGGSLQRVKGHIGLGLMAHSRDLYTPLTKTLPKVVLNNEGLVGWPFYRSAFAPSSQVEGALNWLGEDVTFHARALAAGAELWVDTRVRAVHRGEYDYRIEDCFFKVQNVETLEVTLEENGPEAANNGELEFGLEPTTYLGLGDEQGSASEETLP